jgi:Na+-transporting methylmalonyl-CoA/oxaloacetate decarboxylase gamma subunit
MNRNVILGLGVVFIFLATVAILGALMPGPRKPTDYLVMGGAATFICLVLLFVLVVYGPGIGVKPENKAAPKDDQTSRTSTDL